MVKLSSYDRMALIQSNVTFVLDTAVTAREVLGDMMDSDQVALYQG